MLRWIHLLTPGRRRKDGYTFTFDDAAEQQALENFARASTALRLDYDHQLVRVAPGDADSVTLARFCALARVRHGRVVDIVCRGDEVAPPDAADMPDGVWGAVNDLDVTPLGRKLLRGNLYRYSSIAFDPSSFDVFGNAVNFALNSVAAVNSPHVTSLQAMTFSRSNSPSLVTFSTGAALRLQQEHQPMKILIRSSNAEFGALVAEKVRGGMSVAEALQVVNKEHPQLYSKATPSGAGARTFAGSAHGSTRLPATPLSTWNPRNSTASTPAPEATQDEYAAFEHDWLECGVWYLPKHDPEVLRRWAEVASGRKLAQFLAGYAKTPSLVGNQDLKEVFRKRYSNKEWSLVGFISSKMNADGTFQPGPRLE
jgi:hypothetical protein